MQKADMYRCLIVAVSALGGLLFGFDTSIIAGAVPFIQQYFDASDIQIELIVSMSVLGAFFGALLSGRITDFIGRRITLFITGMLFIAGTVISGYAADPKSLILGRFLLGVAIGVASYAVPLFIAEIAPAESRGMCVLWNGAFLTGGQVIAFCVGCFFTSAHDWRAMILVGVIPAFLLMIGMCILPSSPRWLMMKNKKHKAISVLKKIRNNHDQVQYEVKEIERSVCSKNITKQSIFDKRIRPVLIIGLVLGIGQQLSGINTVMYYGPRVIRSVGFVGEEIEMIGTLGLGLVNFYWNHFYDCVY